jgi:hypothetical protein
MIENGITSLTNDWVEKKKKKKMDGVTYLIGNKILIFHHAPFLFPNLSAKNHIHIPS